MNEMDWGLKEMNKMNFGLKEVRWNMTIEVNSVTWVGVRLSDYVMM